MKDLEERLSDAIKLFWLTRDKQRREQGGKSGQKDAGLRRRYRWETPRRVHADLPRFVPRGRFARCAYLLARPKGIARVLSCGEELGPGGCCRWFVVGRARVQGAGGAIVREQFQQPDRGSTWQCDGSLGRVSRRCLLPLGASLAWIRVHTRRLREVSKPRFGERAAF